MCAIAGILGPDASGNRLNKLLAPVSHRGEPSYRNEVAILDNIMAIGMHRLGIINERYGRQPVINQDKTIFCVFNGEVYNYKELQIELAPFFDFKLNTEAEVILNAYIHWGYDFVKKLDGKFAIAIIDLNNDDMFLARDPMGVKPLYLLKYNNNIAFASEIKSLTNITQLSDYNPIISLNPGAYWSAGRETNYYKIPNLNSSISSNFSELSALRVSLEKAMQKRIPSNATSIACLLSGGIDSSIIAYIASKYHHNVVAYTLNIAGMESPDYLAAKLICDRFNIKHIIVSPSIKEMQQFYLKHGVYMTESFEPILVRNAVSYYFVCKQIASDGFKYAFTGEGADELFGGYDFIREVGFNQQDSLIKHSLDIISQTYLQMSDRASMYTTLEARVPFMDKEFVNLSMSLPKNYRMSKDDDKIALRKMYKGELPKVICQRKKLGMNHGSGFGINSSSESIYYQAVAKHYQASQENLTKDLATASSYIEEFTLDTKDIEELYNFVRYIECDYQKYLSRERLQLNGALRLELKDKLNINELQY